MKVTLSLCFDESHVLAIITFFIIYMPTSQIYRHLIPITWHMLLASLTFLIPHFYYGDQLHGSLSEYVNSPFLGIVCDTYCLSRGWEPRPFCFIMDNHALSDIVSKIFACDNSTSYDVLYLGTVAFLLNTLFNGSSKASRVIDTPIFTLFIYKVL